jgi:hypothetical protein
MLEVIAIVLMVVGFLLFAVALVILFPYLQLERRADAETIQVVRLQSTKQDHDLT